MKKGFGTWDMNCLVCGDVITNPICTECLAKQIEDWLASKNPELIPQIRFLAKIADSEEGNHSFCLFCGKRIDTCMFCFVQDVLELLQQEYPGLVDSFLKHFSYEAEYTQTPKDILAM